MLRVIKITKKGWFSNSAILESLSDGQRAEVRLNGIFPNNDWVEKWSEPVLEGQRFSGLIKRSLAPGDILDFGEVTNLTPE